MYRYDVRATDPEGGTLIYHLDEDSQNRGMALDAEGRIHWSPDRSDAGQSYSVTVEVEDEVGATSEYTYALAVNLDDEAPKVKVNPLGNVYINREGGYQIEKSEQEEISFQALATDNKGVESLQVFINRDSHYGDADL